MIDTKAIRSKILDLALRGLLTEQFLEDGTAEELYQQIQTEKQELIKAGKIKKEKPLPEITENEKPFDIPESWKWVRLGEAFHVEMGQSPEGTSVSKNGEGIEFHQGKIFFGAKYIIDSNQRTTKPTKIIEANSVLLCVRAPVGKVNITQRKICIGRGLCAITPISMVNLDYLYHFLVTCEKAFADQGTGSTFSAIGGDVIKSHLCPLPPLAEQKRIVEKIEQAFSVLDTIDNLQTKYANNLSALKSKLIDAAIQGKLTKQLPEDGTAEELYQQIQAEKQELIKAGKIKKEKPLPPISEDEIPFEIPGNWKWVRIGTVGITATGGTPAKVHPEYYGGDYPFFKPSDLDAGQHITIASEYLSKSGKAVARQFPKGSILVCCIGSIGKCAIIDKEGTANQQINALIPAICDSDYLLYAINSNCFFHQLNYGSRATTVSIISKSKFDNCIVPLPPLAEQKRIVEMLEEVIKIIDSLPKMMYRERRGDGPKNDNLIGMI